MIAQPLIDWANVPHYTSDPHFSAMVVMPAGFSAVYLDYRIQSWVAQTARDNDCPEHICHVLNIDMTPPVGEI